MPRTDPNDSPSGTVGVGRASSYIIASQGVRLLTQLTTLVVLSRLLPASAFGIAAVTISIIGLGEVLRDVGITTTAIQAPHLSHQQSSNLFWINLGLGALLCAGTACLAPVIAGLLNQPGLTTPLAVASLNFILMGLQAQHQVLLFRGFQSRKLAQTEVFASVCAALVAVALGVAGLGLWALILQQLAYNVIILTTRVWSTRWVPRWWGRGGEVKPILISGLNLSGTSALAFFARNVDNFVISHQFGASALGFYSRAFQLASLPAATLVSPLTRVVIPYLRRLAPDRTAYHDFLIRAQIATGLVGIWLVALGLAYADVLIEVALGGGWGAAVPVFQILVLSMPFQFANSVFFWIFISNDLSKSLLRYSLLSKTITVALVLGGARFGLTGVATAYTVSMILAWPLCLVWLGRVSDAPVLRYARAGAYVAFSGVLAAVWAFAQRQVESAWASVAAPVSTLLVVVLLAMLSSDGRTLVRLFVTVITRGRDSGPHEQRKGIER